MWKCNYKINYEFEFVQKLDWMSWIFARNRKPSLQEKRCAARQKLPRGRKSRAVSRRIRHGLHDRKLLFRFKIRHSACTAGAERMALQARARNFTAPVSHKWTLYILFNIICHGFFCVFARNFANSVKTQ